MNPIGAYLLFRSEYLNLISGDFSSLEESANTVYCNELISNALLRKDINLLPVLKRLSENESLSPDIRNKSSEVIAALTIKSIESESDFHKALKLLSENRIPQTTEILKLLKVNSAEFKRTAINMIGKFRLADLTYFVCECLGIPGLATESYNVLKSLGSSSHNELEKYFIDNAGNTRLSKIILRLLSEKYSERSINFIFLRLWSHSRILKESSARLLLRLNYKCTEGERVKIEHLISDSINQFTWNLSAKIIFEDNGVLITEQLANENERIKSFILNLISINSYEDSQEGANKTIGQNIHNVSDLDIEILKRAVGKTVQKQIIQVFSSKSDRSALNNLTEFFPIEKKDKKDLIVQILNRDYNSISLFTKACALRSIEMIDGLEMAESILALLFSTEQLIIEEAANLISRTDPGLYSTVSERLSIPVKKKLDRIIEKTFDKKELLYEKIQFLAKYFGTIPDDGILFLAAELKLFKNDSDPGGIKHVRWNISKSEAYIISETALGISNYEQDEFYYLTIESILDYYIYFRDESAAVSSNLFNIKE